MDTAGPTAQSLTEMHSPSKENGLLTDSSKEKQQPDDADADDNDVRVEETAGTDDASDDDDDDEEEDTIHRPRRKSSLQSSRLNHAVEDDDDGDDDDDDNDKDDESRQQHQQQEDRPNAIRVAKYFDEELYYGTAEELEGQDDAPEEEKLWHIVYDDGDEEDFDKDELKEGIALFQKTQKENLEEDDYETLLEDTDDDDDEDRDSDDEEYEHAGLKLKQRRRKRRILARRSSRRGKNGVSTASSSGEDDEELSATKKVSPKKKRRRKMMSESMEAKKAVAEERERVRERQQWRRSAGSKGEGTNTSGDLFESADAIVINEARPDDEEEVRIAHDLSVKLKQHQIEGVRFLWKSLVHSISAANKEAGRGAILAHSMGLGKTLQIVTFLHTILLSKPLPFRNAIILGPKNTLYNWWDEFHKWHADQDLEVHLVDPQIQKSIADRYKVIKKWHDNGTKEFPAVLLMSYDQFKLLVSGRPRANVRQELRKRLLDPGPDIAVLDEGHIIANPKTAINSAVMEFKSSRRLILTGTPLSNNLREYHSMVSFVHHNLLSSEKEFRSRFVLPIEAGQFMDATDGEVRLMKRRVHVLNQKLKSVIHRRGYDILEKSLPPKHEYILSVRMNDVQKKLYRKFLERRKIGAEEISFFHAWHSLQRIWNHPRTIHYAEEQRKQNSRRAALKREMDDFLDDDSEHSFHDDDDFSVEEKSWHGSDSEEDDVILPAATGAKMHPDSDGSAAEEQSWNGSDSEEGSRIPAVNNDSSKLAATGNKVQSVENRTELSDDIDKSDDWWEEILGKWPNDLATESGKFEILKKIVLNLRAEDKIGIFSQSIGVLNLIETWLEHHGHDEFEFCKGVDLLRIDGSTPSDKRQQFCDKINDKEDPARVMLVSVKAGALGINLVGINKVVLFDTSFNPTHDVQAIFRAYRFGQTREVSIYRLISAGTMEERIYKKQVEKRALFSRVVDEHQIERHFSKVDVNEMVSLVDDDGQSPKETKTSKIQYKSHMDAPPQDVLFGKILMEDRGHKIPRYHEHDSLLDHKEDEELTEEEKKDAWAEFERAAAQEEARQSSSHINAVHAPPTADLAGGQLLMPANPQLTDILSLHFGGPYVVLGPIQIVNLGPIGLSVEQFDPAGRLSGTMQFAKVGSTKPGMPAELSGVRTGDVLLFPYSNKMISYNEFLDTAKNVRPLAFNVARASPSSALKA